MQRLRAIANVGFGDESLYFKSLKSLKISVCMHVSLCTKHAIRGPFNHVNFTVLWLDRHQQRHP